MSASYFGVGGWLSRLADDTTRTVTDYDEAGNVLGSRDYDDDENAQADWNTGMRAREEARLALDRAMALSATPELLALIDSQARLDRRVENEEWNAPRDVAHSYPLGWLVNHNSLSWESTEQANIWEPGVQGWSPVPI
jgi:hypothetical protein